ncbi:enoyl-CoA hydratase-related protein [Sciscionella sediminilitoris]|uniref:enoyl-CoA hydratase-related protein n=1 Tax=Sciscionella sediminilitoris TaxID=1445613 RepID=UPI0004DF5A08|nr:enoyl-CoA hydratase-related protein [Sciscionella sp. SE31]
MTELVHYTVSDGIATITLDSQHNRNALSRQLRGELRAALSGAQQDEAVRVIVLTHEGPVFCSGMDLKEAGGADAEDQGVNEFPAILDQLWTSETPVVARLAGPARAGGVGMIAAADIVVAAEEVNFAFSEVRIGVVPALISATVLPRLLPRPAHELLLTGAPFSAARAAEIGLINSAVAAGELDAEVSRFTESLTLAAPNALAATKRLLRGERATNPADDFPRLLELSAKHFASEEGQEGIRAFAEKRKPSWVPGQ